MITSLEVTNFKSFRSQNLDLQLRNVLVGPNMSGKSNFIDIFRFLTDLVSAQPHTLGLPHAVSRRGGFSELAWKGEPAGAVSLDLRGTLPTGDDSEARQWHYHLSFLGNHGTSLTVQKETLTCRKQGGEYDLIRPANGNRALCNAQGGVITQVNDLNRSALEYEIPDWEGTELRQLFRSFHFYELWPQAMRQINPSSGVDFLTTFGDNLSSWLMTLQTSYPAAFKRIDYTMTQVFPQIDSVFTRPSQQATVVVASNEKHLRRPVTIWQMSDGELAFLAFLSLLFAPPELGSPLYCVEEPENYLHPRLLETLVKLIVQVQAELPAEQRAQILMSTHSPHLVDQFKLDELVVFEKKLGTTVCTRPSSKQQLRALLDDEQVGLGELFYSGALGSDE